MWLHSQHFRSHFHVHAVQSIAICVSVDSIEIGVALAGIASFGLLCVSQLLPAYPSKEVLQSKLLYAVTQTQGFELT